MIDKTGVLHAYQEGIYYDSANGEAGTVYPVGTSQHPVKNRADLLIILAANPTARTIFIRGQLILQAGDSLTKRLIVGTGESSSSLIGINAATIRDCIFKDIAVEEPVGALFDECTFIDCNLVPLVCNAGSFVIAKRCSLGGTVIGIGPNTFIYLEDCSSGGGAGGTIDCYNGAIVNAYSWHGLLNISEMTNAADRVNVYSGSGDIVIAADCVLGIINIFGSAQVTNNTGGTTVNNYTLDTRTGRQLFSIDYWSIPQKMVVVPGGALDQALPDVTVAALPAGATVVKVAVMFKFRSISNAGAANKLTNAQEIQVRTDAPGAWADAINLVDDQFLIAAATVDAPGDVVMGALNVVAVVAGNDTYNFQWDEAVADVAGLTFNDVQVGLRIWYSI